MSDEGEKVWSAERPPPWLELNEGDSALLLIAPHAGKAGAAARARLHPKVNDLHTAEITRDLAARLNAPSIINAGKDRNELDCNRLAQVLEAAPWMIELLACRVERLIARHGRATVLLIHGWNIIEPRVDFGLGLRRHGEELRPPRGASVSASDDFINGPLLGLSERLRGAGIKPSFGFRYPGGGANNLLQLFTTRHIGSENESLRRLARFARNGEVDALQLELSVAVRMPGRLRDRSIEEIERTFSSTEPHRSDGRAAFRIERDSRRFTLLTAQKTSTTPPARVGVEFFDPAAKVGAFASFDLGRGSTGARIMMLLNDGRVVLFTAEGSVERLDRGVGLGPLRFTAEGNDALLEFRGPAVIVPDGTAYLSIERALASGRLEESVQLAVRMRVQGDALDLERTFSTSLADVPIAALSGIFGRLKGSVTFANAETAIDGAARMGFSLSGLGPQRFVSRRTLWASFGADGDARSIELRDVRTESGGEQNCRVMLDREWHAYQFSRFELSTASPEAMPETISALLTAADAPPARLGGRVQTFVPLSRPGPDGSRIYTSLGCATFELDGRVGAGMFEYSRRTDVRAANPEGAADAEED